MENFGVLEEKLKRTIENYNKLKEINNKLKVENEFFCKEIETLRKENFNLLEFKDKQNKVANKIKKILKKIEELKGI